MRELLKRNGEGVMKYLVTITWLDGSVTRATVNKASLRGFNLKACNGAAVTIVKVRS